MDRQELDEIQASRRAQLRPAGILRLLRGELPLGDTFWIGNYGVALVIVPLGTMALIFANLIATKVAIWCLGIILGAIMLYQIALVRAVWIVARRPQSARGWRWIGLAVTVLNAVAGGIVAANVMLSLAKHPDPARSPLTSTLPTHIIAAQRDFA